MNRDADPFEIANLVTRAERVKRNREIILRAVKASPGTRPGGRRTVISPAPHVEIRLRAMSLDLQDSEGAQPLD